MVLASFQVEDKLGRPRFFQKTFLLANLSIEVVLGMPFLTFSNANIQFAQKQLIQRSYITANAISTTKHVKIINRKEFAKAALDKHVEAFVLYMTFLLIITIYPARKAQIALKILTKYSDFSDVFLEKKTSILPKATELNQHVIKLQKDQQLPYRPIYSLDPIELKMLKTYIEINLTNSFIWPLKSSAGTFILFVEKPDGSLHLCVDYRGLNNLTIKNQYSLLFISKFLDQLGQTKRFIQFDITNAYHWMRIKEGDKWKTAFRT